MTPYDVSFGTKSLSDFDAVCTEFPFVVGGDMKEPYKNEWKDEDGIDAYIPTDGIKEESYDITISVATKGTDVATNVRNIIEYLKSAGTLTITNDYVGFTYENAFLKSYSNTEYFYDDSGNRVAVFSLSFTVMNK